MLSSVASTIKNVVASERSSEDSELGHVVRRDRQGRPSVYEKDLGKGEELLTHIFWAE